MCENISVTRNGTSIIQQNMRLCRLSKSPFVHRAKGNGLERASQHYKELTSTISELVPSDEHAWLDDIKAVTNWTLTELCGSAIDRNACRKMIMVITRSLTRLDGTR